MPERRAPRLVRRLKNEAVREDVMKDLERIGGPAVPALVAALEDDEDSVRRAAAKALGRTGDARAVDPLILALRTEQDGVQTAAATALGTIGQEAVPALVRVVGDEEEVDAVRRYAAWALGRVADARGAEALIAVLSGSERLGSTARSALAKIGAPAVEPLLGSLKNEDSKVRMEAAVVLGRIGDVRAVEPLTATLADGEGKVRIAAVRALGSFTDSRAIDALISALEHDDPRVRREAATLLGRTGDERATRRLLAAAKNEELEIVAGAHLFFIKRGEAGTEQVLIKALKAHGYGPMAEHLFRCGNAQLAEAAREWARERGLRRIDGRPSLRPTQWGNGD